MITIKGTLKVPAKLMWKKKKQALISAFYVNDSSEHKQALLFWELYQQALLFWQVSDGVKHALYFLMMSSWWLCYGKIAVIVAACQCPQKLLFNSKLYNAVPRSIWNDSPSFRNIFPSQKSPAEIPIKIC
jgi:hypothetical protein